jgi:hypothetical protein
VLVGRPRSRSDDDSADYDGNPKSNIHIIPGSDTLDPETMTTEALALAEIGRGMADGHTYAEPLDATIRSLLEMAVSYVFLLRLTPPAQGNNLPGRERYGGVALVGCRGQLPRTARH